MIKKLFFTLLLCFFSCSFIFADGYYVGKGMEGKRLAVHEPEFQGLSSADKTYFSDLVYYVRTYLHDYAGFDIVDVQNLEEIKKLQAKSESAQYNTKTSLTAGLLEFAEYQAFIRISKSGGEFSISLSISDLTTSKVIAESIVNKLKKITDVSDVGVRKLILQIVPKMNVTLTAMGKYTLSGNDTDDLTIEQELNFAKQEEKALQDTLSSVQVELKNISSDVLDMNSVARKAQLEVEKQISEQKLLMAQQKIKRLAEQKEKERIEKEKAINYTEELKKRIKDTSDEVERVAAELRSKKFEGLTFAEQITIIEKEKKAYIELRKKINDEIKNFYTEAEQEYNERKVDVNNSKIYRMGELTNGVPTETAKNIKIAENEKLYKELMQQAKNNEEKLRKENQLESILESIRLKQKELSTSQTINSLFVTDLLTVEAYDAEKKAWKLKINLCKDGDLLIIDYIFLYFNEISKVLGGKTYSTDEMDGKGSSEKYNSYLDDVETYDSLFRMGTPLVNLDVEYIVKALPDDSPSTYEMFVEKYVVKATKNGKIIKKVTSDVSKRFSQKPEYDIRTEEVIKKEKSQQAKKTEDIEKKSIANSKKFGGIGLNLSFGESFAIVGSLEFPIKNHSFLGIDSYFSFSGTLGAGLKYGLYKYLPILNYPCIFTSIGIGLDFYEVFSNLELGLDIPFMETRGLSIKYQLKYSIEDSFSNVFCMGFYCRFRK